MHKRRPYQFSLARLLALCTAVAVCLAAAGALTSSPLGQAVGATYFALHAAIAVMQWPSVRENLHEVRQRRQKIMDERAAMVTDANRKRTGKLAGSSNKRET